MESQKYFKRHPRSPSGDGIHHHQEILPTLYCTFSSLMAEVTWNEPFPHCLAKESLLLSLQHKVNISFYLGIDQTLWGSSILKVIKGRSAKSATGDHAQCQRYDSHLAMYSSSGWAPSDSVFPPLLWVMPWNSFHSSSRCACVGEIAKCTPKIPLWASLEHK